MRSNGLRSLVLVLLVLGAAAACSDSVAPVVDPPAQYITIHRAWQPGERDSVVAHVMASHSWVFPYVGDISGYANQMLDPDSVVDVVANPAFLSADQGLASIVMGTQWNTSWNIFGIDVQTINNTVAPPDTIRSVGVFWSNPAEQNWVGFVLAFTRNPTLAQTAVNTTAYDAAFGKAGAGGGEARNSNGTSWIADSTGIVAPRNTITITANGGYGTANTVNSGPFLGGTMANGFGFSGRLNNISIRRKAGSTAPATQLVDLTFTNINSVQIICKFKVPCTTNVP